MVNLSVSHTEDEFDPTEDEFNLHVLNVWLALCNGDKGIGSTRLYELEFKVKKIEQSYQFPNVVVKPELTIFSLRKGHVLLIESKSGFNIPPKQMASYENVITLAGAGARFSELETKFIEKKSHLKQGIGVEVVYVGRHHCVERLTIGLNQSRHPFPLLSLGKEMRLRLNRFQDADLNEVFDSPIDIEVELIPKYLPAYSDSPEWKLAELALNKFINNLIRGECGYEIEKRDLCAAVWTQTWELFSDSEKSTLEKKLFSVLRRASLNDLFVWSQNSVTVVDNYSQLTGKSHSSYISRLQGKIESLLKKLGKPSD